MSNMSTRSRRLFALAAARSTAVEGLESRVMLTTVSTGAAVSVTATSATLDATVNPQGMSTAVKFQYSTSPSFTPTGSGPVVVPFSYPAGAAFDSSGDIFVADYGLNAVKEILPNGSFKTIGSGFSGPADVVVDAKGDVFVSDLGDNAIKEVMPNGTTKTLGSGFNAPSAVAVDSAGDVFVADTGNNAVKEILPNGTIKTLGVGFNGPSGIAINPAGDVVLSDTGNGLIKEILRGGTVKTLATGFSSPEGLTVDASGDVFVADFGDNSVKEILLGGSIKTLGSGFSSPNGVAVDSAGDVVVAESGNSAVKEILPNGTIKTLGAGYYYPEGLAVDAAGDLFVAGELNNEGIAKVMPDGTVKIIGSGFWGPQGLAVDAAGDVFVADSYNNAVKEILPNGTIKTLGYGFNYSAGVAVNKAGDVFVSDYGNNAVKEIFPNGTVKTVLTEHHPLGVAVDAAGDLFISGDYSIRELFPNGTIKVLNTGLPVTGIALDKAGDVFFVDSLANSVMELLANGTVVTISSDYSNPADVALDAAGNLFVSDFNDNVVDKLSPPSISATPSTLTGSGLKTVSGKLMGLTPGTTYYYRAVVSTAAGTVVDSHVQSFSTVATGSISGTTLADVSGNGLNSTNTVLPGVKVYLFADTTGSGTYSTADKLLQTLTTASNGTYSFAKLPAGHYIVTENAPKGDLITGPSPASYYAVDLTADGQVSKYDFANFVKPSSVGISQVKYTIGSHSYSSLTGHTLNGETVSITFTVDSSAAASVSLVEYSSTTSTFSATTANQQKVAQYVSVQYAAGTTDTISITLPKTGFYSLDFVEGAVITQFGPAGSNVFYTPQNRLISSDYE